MSWSIKVAGPKEACKRAVQHERFIPVEIKTIICRLVDEQVLPAAAPSGHQYQVWVQSHGHVASGGGMQNATFEVSYCLADYVA